jgi:hypothetical protein
MLLETEKIKLIVARPKNQNPERELQTKRSLLQIIQNLKLISH